MLIKRKYIFGVLLIYCLLLLTSCSVIKEVKTKEVEDFEFGVPEYPTKIGFEDFDEKRNRREDIDSKFIQNLNEQTFSTTIFS